MEQLIFYGRTTFSVVATITMITKNPLEKVKTSDKFNRLPIPMIVGSY